MDQSVDGWLGDGPGSYAEARVSVFDRSRHAIAHFTALMVALSVTFAVVGSQVGAGYLADQTVLSPSGGQLTEPQSVLLDPAAPNVSEESSAADESPAPTLVESPPGGGSSAETSSPTSTTDPETAGAETSAATTAPATPGSSAPAAAESATTGPVVTGPLTTAPAPVDDSPAARGLRALGAISYPWQRQLPGWTIDFQDGRSGLYGLTLVDDKRIEIYVRHDQPQDLLVHIVAHEIGHAVDVTLNDGPDRRRWQGARNIGDAPWWPDSAASDFRTGAGDFAESFAYWQTRTANYRSKLGPAPNNRQIDLMAELAYG